MGSLAGATAESEISRRVQAQGKHRMHMLETLQRRPVGRVATTLEHDLSVPFEPVRLEHPEKSPRKLPEPRALVEIFMRTSHLPLFQRVSR